VRWIDVADERDRFLRGGRPRRREEIIDRCRQIEVDWVRSPGAGLVSREIEEVVDDALHCAPYWSRPDR